MTLLDVNNLTVRYGSLTIVDNVSFSLSEGEWLMLIGPNGAGKSTIVNAISQGTPYTGEVRFCNRDVRHYRAHEMARNIGVLSQSHPVGYGFTVGSVVRLGRYAYSPGLFSNNQNEDEQMVARALELTGMARFAEQSVLTLSGGELQRTFLAQLFAQNPRVLLLDEPTNHLDLVYQKQIFELISQWLKIPGLFSNNQNEDEQMVARALELTGMARFAEQSVLTLSGGELQRTFLAQLFAQNPRVLLLDEPTNHLDLVYQKQIFELISQWLKTPGRAVLSVVHDLSLARAYGSRALLLDGGKTVACGKISEVFSPNYIDKAYAMDVSAWMRGMFAQWQEEETK